MKNQALTLLSASALLLAVNSAQAQSILIDFDTDQTNLFDKASGNDYTYSATAGIGGTGGLEGGVDGAVWSYNGASYTFDGPEDEITFSMDILYDAGGGDSPAIPLRIGLQDDGPEGFGDYAARLDSRDNGLDFDGQTGQLDTTSFTLTDGNWYRGEFTITGTSTAGVIDWSYNFLDLGASGTATPNSLASNSGTGAGPYSQFTNSGTNPLEFSFKVNDAAAQIDNIGIAVIPEPSSAILLMGALGTLLVVRRRRS